VNSHTQIKASAVRDSSLSFKARGIHHVLLSYLKSWQITLDDLIQQSDKDGRTSISSGLSELESKGYLEKTQVRDADTGLFAGYEYNVSDTPIESWRSL
jgi:hypothetical protein